MTEIGLAAADTPPQMWVRGMPLALTLLLGMPAAGNAADGGKEQRLEVWAGGSLIAPVLDTVYETRFSPSFGSGPVDSMAGQQLVVQGNGGAGAELGLGWLPNRRWSIRLSADWSAGDLSGANSPYSWSVRYLASQPPSNEPRPIQIAERVEWPDTEGRLHVFTLALGAARRWEGGRIGGGLSAGLGWVRTGAEIRSIGYTTFHLGGHSTFFPQEFAVEVSLDPSSVAAFQAGAELDVALARSWRLRLDYRFLRATEATLHPRVTRVVNAEEVIFDEPISRIETDLALAPFRIDPSSSRLLLSLVFRR